MRHILSIAAALLLSLGGAFAQNLPPGTTGAACLATSAPLSITVNQYTPLNCDLSGNLRTTGSGGGSTGGSVTAPGTAGTQAQAVQGVPNGVPQDVNAGDDTTIRRGIRTTTTGSLEPPTAATGKINSVSVSLAANTSTQLIGANSTRIAMGIQCQAGAVSVSETGAALSSAAVGSGTLFIPSGTAPYFTPPVTTRTAITAYTATAQTCAVTEYLR